MTKLSIAFLAGVLMMAGIVYFAGPRSFALPMFAAGSLAVLVPLAALLGSVSRIRATARFLSAFAHAWEKRLAPDAQLATVLPAVVDPLVEDVTSALINQKTPKKIAAAAAVEACKSNREFEPAYRAAVAMVNRKAA